jgi:hypothetical protein
MMKNPEHGIHGARQPGMATPHRRKAGNRNNLLPRGLKKSGNVMQENDLQDSKSRCESCGAATPGYDSVNFGYIEDGYRLLCTVCLNAEAAANSGACAQITPRAFRTAGRQFADTAPCP